MSSLAKIFKSDKARIVGLRKDFWWQVCEFHSISFEYDLEKVNDSQFRLSKDNKVIDVYPVGFKYHKIHNNQRGELEDIEKFVNENFGENSRPYEPKRKHGRKSGLTIESRMPIGKYKGTRIKDLDKKYLKYIYENDFSSKEILKLIKENYEELFGQ
jgi:hypothetical protein